MIEYVPTARADVAHGAVRVLPLPVSATPPQPAMITPLARNTTLPVGAVPVTDAVNVTGVPTTDGLTLEARPVVVTVCAGHDDVVNVYANFEISSEVLEALEA